MCIHPRCSYSRARCLNTRALTGVISQSIAHRFRGLSVTAMQTRLRCESGRVVSDRTGFKFGKVLLGIRAVRGRGTASFGKFSGSHGSTTASPWGAWLRD